LYIVGWLISPTAAADSWFSWCSYYCALSLKCYSYYGVAYSY